MGYERGPSQPSEMPMAPRVALPGLFQGLGVSHLERLRGIDEALGVIITTTAPIATTELGPQFDGDVIPAWAGIATVDDPNEGPVLREIAGGLEAGADDLAGQQRDLPGPDELEPVDDLDAPIEGEPFDNDHPGRGGQKPGV